jgi:N6-L-threonylcarbamoyladenine synthase
MFILGIESSCDETAMAIYHAQKGLLAHVIHSQIQTHLPYGGVVPELASRDHIKQMVPLLAEVLKQAELTKAQLNAIAYTQGPGLVGALLTGACFAKSLAFALNIPAIGVHHLEAHLLAAQLETRELAFPFLVLLVSGGHTQLIKAQALGEYTLLGETLDDAVGEAFDKTAKMLGFDYPGGPILAKLAETYPKNQSLPFAPFPKPMTDRPGLDFSFSGLKTHSLMTWQKSKQDQASQQAIAYAFQTAVVDTLKIKCQRALQQTSYNVLVVAGGVGANKALRSTLNHLMQQRQGKAYFPRPEFCTDNGAMVAYAGACHLLRGEKDNHLQVNVKARWPLPLDER